MTLPIGWMFHYARKLSKITSDFREIWHRCSTCVSNFTANFRYVKVKVQGQNRSTENFKICHLSATNPPSDLTFNQNALIGV